MADLFALGRVDDVHVELLRKMNGVKKTSWGQGAPKATPKRGGDAEARDGRQEPNNRRWQDTSHHTLERNEMVPPLKYRLHRARMSIFSFTERISEEEVMETITLLGIDLAKNTFQLHGINHQSKVMLKRQLSRSKLLEFTANLPSCTIAMEACGGSHYFSRKFQSFGHQTRLIAPQFVKPYVKGNKNDAADAEAICEAASRPSMRFITTKAVWQQDLQSLHRIRQRLSRNRTALMNEIRGILYEYGISIAQGRSALKQVAQLLSTEEPMADLSQTTRVFLQNLYSELLEIEEKINGYERQLREVNQKNRDSEKLMSLRGIGEITSTALLGALGDPTQFKNGRQFAAWMGVVPRHTGTGGKHRILTTSKRGNKYLRSLMVHGARSVINSVRRKSAKGIPLDSLEQWIHRLYLKKGYNKTAVALANKNARMAWALVSTGQSFEAKKAARLETMAS